MQVAVFGAGALGAVYGVRLATRGGADVTFVVRRARARSKEPLVIETVRGHRRETIEAPVRSDVVPPHADVILLAVGTEDIEALAEPLSTSEAPIVVLTPMLPKQWARVRAALGGRVLAAIPNVIAYTRSEDGVVRYWTPPAPMKIDEPRAAGIAVQELAAALERAGLSARFELGVHEKNPATTVCFIPIGMVIAIAGGTARLMEDDVLLSLAARACGEGVRLAHRIGEPEPWARLAPMLAAPWAMRAWLGMLRRLSPEALFYAEEHFGRKLKEQHRVMIREMIDFARDKGLPHEAFDQLATRLGA